VELEGAEIVIERKSKERRREGTVRYAVLAYSDAEEGEEGAAACVCRTEKKSCGLRE
jgi:hypothetical protein